MLYGFWRSSWYIETSRKIGNKPSLGAGQVSYENIYIKKKGIKENDYEKMV